MTGHETAAVTTVAPDSQTRIDSPCEGGFRRSIRTNHRRLPRTLSRADWQRQVACVDPAEVRHDGATSPGVSPIPGRVASPEDSVCSDSPTSTGSAPRQCLMGGWGPAFRLLRGRQGFQAGRHGFFHSFGLKGQPFSQPELEALDIDISNDSRAESPAILRRLSRGERSNGQPVGPLDSSEPKTRAFSPGDENDRPFGPEETRFCGISPVLATWEALQRNCLKAGLQPAETDQSSRDCGVTIPRHVITRNGEDGTRTHDPRLMNPLLYQLSYLAEGRQRVCCRRESLPCPPHTASQCLPGEDTARSRKFTADA